MTAPPPSIVRTLRARGAREGALLWGFLRTDVLATHVPALGFLVAALLTYHVPWQVWPRFVGGALLYFTTYTLCLTIPNQIMGVVEDRVNKPFRPLPRALVTRGGAWGRWAIALAIFVTLGMLCHLGWPTALWIAVCLLYDIGGWDRHWWTKQLCMGVGVFVQLDAAWGFVGPPTPLALRWIVFLAVLAPLIMPLADLRDVAGDRAVGRQTLPICWGDTPTRWLLIELFLLVPFVTLVWLIWPAAPTGSGLVLGGGLGVVGWGVAWRLWTRRSPQEDHVTYLLANGWYIGVIGAAVLLVATGAGRGNG